jgi:hypothetical protein
LSFRGVDLFERLFEEYSLLYGCCLKAVSINDPPSFKLKMAQPVSQQYLLVNLVCPDCGERDRIIWLRPYKNPPLGEHGVRISRQVIHSQANKILANLEKKGLGLPNPT